MHVRSQKAKIGGTSARNCRHAVNCRRNSTCRAGLAPSGRIRAQRRAPSASSIMRLTRRTSSEALRALGPSASPQGIGLTFDGPPRPMTLVALFGHGAMSDLSPLCAPKRTLPTTAELWVHPLIRSPLTRGGFFCHHFRDVGLVKPVSPPALVKPFAGLSR